MKKSKPSRLVPLAVSPVAAGFPSPATDYMERPLDLNELLIRHPAATFFVRVTGDSMRDASVHPGDLLIVDRALEPRDGSVVVAVVDGEFTVKTLRWNRTGVQLLPANPRFRPIVIDENTDFSVWGVATHVIHALNKPEFR